MFKTIKLLTAAAILLMGSSSFAQTVQLNSTDELLNTVKQFSATFLFFGHGSKSQFADVPAVLADVDRVVSELNAKYGAGNWLATFGGDLFNPEKPDIGVIMKHLSDSGVRVLAIQSDVVIGYGGVDKYIDYVHYVQTTKVPEIAADGSPVVVDGKIKMKTIWGGFLNGKPAGPTAIYLGPEFIDGPSPLLKGVIAFGGGPIALEEVAYAHKHGISVDYIRAEALYPEVNGKYGSVDAWAQSPEGSGARSCAGTTVRHN